MEAPRPSSTLRFFFYLIVRCVIRHSPWSRSSRGPALGNGAEGTGGVASTREAPARRCRQSRPPSALDCEASVVFNCATEILS